MQAAATGCGTAVGSASRARVWLVQLERVSVRRDANASRAKLCRDGDSERFATPP